MDSMLRRITPVVLILLGISVWAAPWVIPDQGVMRFVVGVLCLYTAMLVFERQRMEQRFTQVLGSFKQFYNDRGGASPSVDQEKSLQAVSILVAALKSPDSAVREAAQENLKRLTGMDFGADPAAWNEWLAKARQVAEADPSQTP